MSLTALRARSGAPPATGLLLLGLLVIAAFLAALCLGPVRIPPARVVQVLAEVLGLAGDAAPSSLRDRVVVMDVRLPRAVLGALVGAATALAGAIMQGVFRNPLADPGLIGVSPGAALAAVAFIVLGAGLSFGLPPALQGLGLSLAAFAGGLGTTLLIGRLAMREGYTSTATLLFAGLALGALASAGTGVLVFMASEQQTREFLFWTLGSLGGATWLKTALTAPFVLALLVAAPLLSRGLDALALGEAEAFHMGIAVERLKRWAIVAVALGVGASVAACGVIGFLGLVVPHLVRLTLGPGHRLLLPGAALMGAAVLLVADIVARLVAAPAELPLGVVTALAGAPFFLWLLLRRRGLGG